MREFHDTIPVSDLADPFQTGRKKEQLPLPYY